jgi:tubulin gamma
MISDFDKIYKKKAFLNTYQQSSLFSDNLDEFEESREVVTDMIEEYKLCEKSDYPDLCKKNVK